MGSAGDVSGMRAVLLGPNQQENLALQYLAAAARQAGHEARRMAFNSPTDIANATKAVIELAPDVVGIAMQFQHSIGDGLQLARAALHERAFAFDSLLNRLISLSFGRQLHEHFFPDPSTDRLSREVLDLVCTVHADTLEILDEARASAAGKTMKPEDARQWAVNTALAASRRDLPWYAQVGRLWEHLHLRGRGLLGWIGTRPDGS